jgi:serine/threonine protein kinase
LLKHLHDPLPLPRKLDPSIPEPFERIVLKALAKQPDDRYQSAVDMARALYNAAEQLGIVIPEHVFLPVPAPMGDLPVSDGVVFSGEERLQIPETNFEADDTDKALYKKLSMDQSDIRRLKKWIQNLLSRLSNLPTPEIGILRAVTISLGLFILANLFALTVGLIASQEVIFGRGWPIELLLVSILFSLVMAATRSFWWLIPGGLLLGNGMIFSYYALTGFWTHWIFWWPLEPLLIAAVFFGTRGLLRHKKDYPGLSRTLGYLGTLVSIAWGALVALGVALVAVITLFG